MYTYKKPGPLYLMTIPQLAEYIASMLNYSKIWKSNFPACDFTITDVVAHKQYSQEALLKLHENASGWYGIRAVDFGLDSTTLFAVADLFGGGCDHICRFYDGIGILEAEIILQETLCSLLEVNTSDKVFLLVELREDKSAKTEEGTSANEKDILKCPCGGTPILKSKYSFCHAGHGKSYYIHWVECPDCGKQTPAYNDLDNLNPKAMAIAHWNKKGSTGQIFGEYSLTGVSDAPGKTRWWLEKTGHAMAMHCFDTNGSEQEQKAAYDQQIAQIDDWIKTFDGLYLIMRGR